MADTPLTAEGIASLRAWATALAPVGNMQAKQLLALSKISNAHGNLIAAYESSKKPLKKMGV